MVRYVYRKLYQAHYYTPRGIQIALTPLRSTNMFIYTSSIWHNLQHRLKYIQEQHSQVILLSSFVPLTSCCMIFFLFFFSLWWRF